MARKNPLSFLKEAKAEGESAAMEKGEKGKPDAADKKAKKGKK
jgi:hypothetical protein